MIDVNQATVILHFIKGKVMLSAKSKVITPYLTDIIFIA